MRVVELLSSLSFFLAITGFFGFVLLPVLASLDWIAAMPWWEGPLRRQR
jgi:hypothetical protein